MCMWSGVVTRAGQGSDLSCCCAAETSAIDVTHPSPPVLGVGALVEGAEGVAALRQPLKDLPVQPRHVVLFLACLHSDCYRFTLP